MRTASIQDRGLEHTSSSKEAAPPLEVLVQTLDLEGRSEEVVLNEVNSLLLYVSEGQEHLLPKALLTIRNATRISAQRTMDMGWLKPLAMNVLSPRPLVRACALAGLAAFTAHSHVRHAVVDKGLVRALVARLRLTMKESNALDGYEMQYGTLVVANLAANPSAAVFLRDSNAVSALLDLMKDLSQMYVASAVLRSMKTAPAALPATPAWQTTVHVINGLLNMAHTEADRQVMLEAGLVVLLERVLDSLSRDPIISNRIKLLLATLGINELLASPQRGTNKLDILKGEWDDAAVAEQVGAVYGSSSRNSTFSRVNELLIRSRKNKSQSVDLASMPGGHILSTSRSMHVEEARATQTDDGSEREEEEAEAGSQPASSKVSPRSSNGVSRSGRSSGTASPAVATPDRRGSTALSSTGGHRLTSTSS